ncbi:MAG: hypothetical protein JWN14_3959 [Chthonomonadales bacterium]|nr:hypothetical protein [Chthonomonadales bacterium]
MFLMTLRQLFGNGSLYLALTALFVVQGAPHAYAQNTPTLEAFQGIYAGNFGNFVGITGNGGPNSASDPFHDTVTFTGNDLTGNLQQMTVDGTAFSSAGFGHMHVYGSGTVTNSYYNPANLPLTDQNGNFNVTGSPDLIAVHGNAGWTDTFTYTGLQGTGYKVNYYFNLVGTATGDTEAGLNFSTSDPGGLSYNPRTSAGSALWITPFYQVDWGVPFDVSADFYGGMTTYVSQKQDGSTYSATGNYADTLTLSGIQVVDANDNPVSGWSLTSASGTQYPLAAPTPEPGSLALLCSVASLGALGGFRRFRSLHNRTR